MAVSGDSKAHASMNRVPQRATPGCGRRTLPTGGDRVAGMHASWSHVLAPPGGGDLFFVQPVATEVSDQPATSGGTPGRRAASDQCAQLLERQPSDGMHRIDYRAEKELDCCQQAQLRSATVSTAYGQSVQREPNVEREEHRQLGRVDGGQPPQRVGQTGQWPQHLWFQAPVHRHGPRRLAGRDA